MENNRFPEALTFDDILLIPRKAMVQPPIERFKKMYDPRNYTIPEDRKRMMHCITREFIKDEEDFPCVKCFRGGLEFLERNRQADSWLLQIECFDPHEPFFAPRRFRDAMANVAVVVETSEEGDHGTAFGIEDDGGGGTVYLPPGQFLSGTIYLKSNVTLRLAAGSTLLGSTDLKDYPPTVPALRLASWVAASGTRSSAS